MREKILFVAESITLAQVVRLVSLARALDARRYEVHFASAAFPDLVFVGTTFQRHALRSVSPERIALALQRGQRLYDAGTLRRYVRDDIALIRAVRPDLIIGDFRLSLAISAPHTGVPHVALVNAYWSPYVVRRGFPLPDHPMVRLLGEARAARHFPKALPYVFAHFARPVNALRKAYGLSPIGSLPSVLTHGDHVMYADTPSLVPTSGAPATHTYLGPVLWTPEHVAPPVDVVDAGRPCVYVTLGSSGNMSALSTVIEALAPLPLTVLVATAGRTRLAHLPANVHAFDYLPGDWAARCASLVVSNGGSSTGYQALAAGTPVLGVASNLDQFLAMSAIVDAGAGEVLRASTLTASAVRTAASRLIASDHHRERARAVQQDFANWSFGPRFRALVARLTGHAEADEDGEEVTPRRSDDRAPARDHRAIPIALAALLALSVVLGGTARAESNQVPSTNEIRFSAPVEGNKGHVICALFRKDGWLKTPIQWKKVVIRDGEAECIFSSVAPDMYAISAFHDENDNERLDTNFLGIPSESWCTSRDAKAYFGPPSFDDAKFRYTGSVMRQRSSLK